MSTWLFRRLVVFASTGLLAAAAGTDAARAQGQAAEPLVANGAALDVHTHIASQVLTDRFTGGGVPNAGAEDLIARLDEGNVRRAVILSAAYLGEAAGFTDDSNMAPENDFVAGEVAKYPDRLIGFCGINPLYPSAPAEVDRCLDLTGMVGVKIHLEGSSLDLNRQADFDGLNAVFDRIAAHDAPVLMHVADRWGVSLSGDALAHLAIILGTHPEVRVAHAHCAGNTDDHMIETWLRVRQSGYNAETSYVDVSACLAFYADAPLSQRELIVWRFRKWGIDHVLFGSDYFALFGETPRQTLDILTKYPFTQEDLDTILSNDGSGWLGR